MPASLLHRGLGRRARDYVTARSDAETAPVPGFAARGGSAAPSNRAGDAERRGQDALRRNSVPASSFAVLGTGRNRQRDCLHPGSPAPCDPGPIDRDRLHIDAAAVTSTLPASRLDPPSHIRHRWRSPSVLRSHRTAVTTCCTSATRPSLITHVDGTPGPRLPYTAPQQDGRLT